MAMNGRQSESFTRWQSVTRDQFSSVSSLVLGLSTGVLAFAVVGFGALSPSNRCLIIAATAAVLFLSASIALAIICALNRLNDFRITARIVRDAARGEISVEDLRRESRVLGTRSWALLRWQLWLFVAGVFCVGVNLIAKLWE